MKSTLLFASGIVLSLTAFAQNQLFYKPALEPMAHTPTFRITVVSRSVQAVNYKHRSGSSKLDFAGTDLMPSANGVAEVNSKRGSIEIDAGIWRSAQTDNLRQRVSDLRFVGNFRRRPCREPGRKFFSATTIAANCARPLTFRPSL